MAVQLPNFLAAQLVKPDYSGIGDLFENYYGGKALKQNDTINESKVKEAPLDLLMKQIQAEFARPNAETALSGAKLGNAGKGLSNQHMAMQLSQLRKQIDEQNAMETMIKQAMASSQGGSGGGMQGGGGFGGQAQPNMPVTPNAYQPIKMNDMGEALSKVMGNPMMQGQSVPTTAPLMNDHPAEMERVQSQHNEKVQELEPGTSSLYGIDRLYDMNPLARPYLEKKGYKKEVKRESDKRAGVERIYTKWPSGKITVKTVTPQLAEGEEPPVKLTNAVMGQNQRVITSVDNALPEIEKLKKLKHFDNWSLIHGDESNLYSSMIAGLKDNLLGAFGLYPTEHGLKTVEDMVKIGRTESKAGYLKRIEKLVQTLKEKQSYSKKLLKNAIPLGGNASDMSDEELRNVAYGE